MSEKAAMRISAALCCVGLGYMAFEYESVLAGIGCAIALMSSFD